MTVTGKLTRRHLAQTMPVHADPLHFESASFSGVNQVTFSYRTKTDAAAKLLPVALEIEEHPKVSVTFLNYGFSGVGPFREYIQLIHASFRGDDVGFVPHEAVTPVGKPVTERLTLPVNPYSGVTVIVEVPELP